MALYLDRIDGAGFLHTRDGIQHRRIAVVSGVSTANPAAVSYLATQTGGMPQHGDPHPNHADARLTDIEAIGISDADDTIRILLTYNTPTGSLELPAGQSWYVEYDTGLTGRTAQIVPGQGIRKAIVVNFKDPSTGKVYEHQGQINFLAPIKTLRIIGGTATGANIDRASRLVGRVNREPFIGDPRGYWLLSGIRVTSGDGGRSYRAEVTAISRCTEDWSEWVWGYDHNLGKNFHVKQSDIDKLAGRAYEHDVLYPDNDASRGIARVGPYHYSSFSTVFGGIKRPQ